METLGLRSTERLALATSQIMATEVVHQMTSILYNTENNKHSAAYQVKSISGDGHDVK